MLLLDTNVLMYTRGGDHPYRDPCAGLLRRIGNGETAAAVDAETLQEILHRYRMSARPAMGAELYALARKLMPEVLPITGAVMDDANRLLDFVPGASVRDAVHAAVARTHGIAICSYDKDFDQFPGVRRVEP